MNDLYRPFIHATKHPSSESTDELTVSQVQDWIAAYVTPLDATETVTLHNAVKRILATDIISPINVPAHNNSAMDGYALRGVDLPSTEQRTLPVVGTAYAGHPYLGTIEPGSCIRIMTGAVMPDSCDTVIPQELVHSCTQDSITIKENVVQPGRHCRAKGEDLAQGQVALKKGRMLRPSDLGLLASLGIGEIEVKRRVRVACFSTGDELQELREPLVEGNIYDSNRYTLYGMLQMLGCDMLDMGIVKDDPVALERALSIACENADVIVTTGGVSVGAADYTKQVLDKLGEVMFCNIALRPGRPLVFGSITSHGNKAYLFGLPGNPVATVVSFYLFVRDALLRMLGREHSPTLSLKAKAQTDIPKKIGRTEFSRGIFFQDADGILHVKLTGDQGSGILRSLAEANCLIVADHEQGCVKAGELVNILPIDAVFSI